MITMFDLYLWLNPMAYLWLISLSMAYAITIDSLVAGQPNRYEKYSMQ